MHPRASVGGVPVTTQVVGSVLDGEIALLDGAARSTSVTVLGPCELLIVSRDGFKQLMAARSDLAERVVEPLAQRVLVLTHNVRSLALGTAYGRLAVTLMSLEKSQDSVWVLEERLTHQELANMVGVSREMVTHLFSHLIAGGYITVEKRRTTIQRVLILGTRVWEMDRRFTGNQSQPRS